MRYPHLAAALLLTSLSSSAATLTISPSLITSCLNGLGRATLTWSEASEGVRLVVGPGHAAMTGPSAPSGSSTSGDWISDGLVFRLLAPSGAVEAEAVARVECSAALPPPEVGASDESYFPLAIGNTWVYRYDSRQTTSSYLTRRVIGTRSLGGHEYFVIQVEQDGAATQQLVLREDAEGRIWEFTGTSSEFRETAILEPQFQFEAPYSNHLGVFPAVVAPVTNSTLERIERVFARGVGLLSTKRTLLTGSSGGFVDGMELVEVRIRGGVHLSLPARKISLATELRRLNLSGRAAPNCAVPAYCAACGLTGADPAGTYKPCTQVRVETASSDAFVTTLMLLNSADEVVFSKAFDTSEPGEQLEYVKIPLFTESGDLPSTKLIEPFPAGRYRVVATMFEQDATPGDPAASASAAMEIEIE